MNKLCTVLLQYEYLVQRTRSGTIISYLLCTLPPTRVVGQFTVAILSLGTSSPNNTLQSLCVKSLIEPLFYLNSLALSMSLYIVLTCLYFNLCYSHSLQGVKYSDIQLSIFLSNYLNVIYCTTSIYLFICVFGSTLSSTYLSSVYLSSIHLSIDVQFIIEIEYE